MNDDFLKEIEFVCQIPQIRKMFENKLKAVKEAYGFEISCLSKNVMLINQGDAHYDTVMVDDPLLWEYIDDMQRFPAYKERRVKEHRVNMRAANLSTN